ncbi:MAG TPA: electron transport complex subunit RsxC [Clostridiales bacterium]|nr:electron transport complex subunit RsxC [Clostridiales bacterium]
MKLFGKTNFHGGVHMGDGSDKELTSNDKMIIYQPKTVEISMKQSGGRPCNPIVNIGDRVIKGQVIGTPTGFGVANIHASVSGTVMDMVTNKESQDNDVLVITIEADTNNGDDQLDTEIPTDQDYHTGFTDISSFSKEDIISSMKDGGLIGMGGAGFPTHVKYETDKTIDYVLINAAECEPFLTCDHRLMLEFGYDILNGVNLLLKASEAKKAIICIEDNKIDAANYLNDLLLEQGLPIEVKILETRYPQGGERQLTEAVLRKEVPAGKLPADIGVIINNVATAKAVADLMFANTPLIYRCITITGKVKKPANYFVPIGTRYSELVELSGGFTTVSNRVIVGGPMTGNGILYNSGISELEGSVTKTSSGLLVLEDMTIIESPCIRCGECERVCPAGLAPYKIDYAFITRDYDLCEKLHSTECISCGCCSFVCPAKRELAYRTTGARYTVANIRSKRRDKQNEK